MIPEAIREEAARIGQEPWMNLKFEARAQTVRDRLMQEQPRRDPSIGLMPDGSYVVWYNPSRTTWNQG